MRTMKSKVERLAVPRNFGIHRLILLVLQAVGDAGYRPFDHQAHADFGLIRLLIRPAIRRQRPVSIQRSSGRSGKIQTMPATR